MSEPGFNFFKFVFVVGIFFNAASTGRFVEAVVEGDCAVTGTDSYCLDCLNFAFCMGGTSGQYALVKCPINKACKIDADAKAACIEPLDTNCQCPTHPAQIEDPYDEDKWLVCLNSNDGSNIECKKGGIYNDVTGICDQVTIPTIPPLIPTTKPCNNKFEFICLGCDYFQVCFSDGTESVTKCEEGEQCDANQKKCVLPPTSGCDTTAGRGFQPDTRNCSNYYFCDETSSTPLGNYTCPSGEVYDSVTKSCTADSSKCKEPYDCTTDGNDASTTQSMTSSTPAKISTTTTTVPAVTCDCSPTVKTCAIDCKNFYSCYENPPGTYTPIEKTCPYDLNFNPSTGNCEPISCVDPVN